MSLAVTTITCRSGALLALEVLRVTGDDVEDGAATQARVAASELRHGLNVAQAERDAFRAHLAEKAEQLRVVAAERDALRLQVRHLEEEVAMLRAAFGAPARK